MHSRKISQIIKTYADKFIITDGSVIRCTLCDVSIKIDEKHQSTRINQHVLSKKHLANKELQFNKGLMRQQFIGDALSSSNIPNKNVFFMDTLKAFVGCGIPLWKLNDPLLISYLEKYTGKSIPDESTLRKLYMQTLYEEKIRQIKETLGHYPLYFILDETTDRQNRYVLNILVGPLNGQKVKPMLWKMYFLDKVDNVHIMQSFNNACVELWPQGIEYDRVWLVLTDQASYMMLAISNLKAMYSHLKHVTCIAHALHLVCEMIKDDNPNANEFISSIKKMLRKAPARIQKYLEITGLPLPPVPHITRWGTWLTAAVFTCNNYQSICQFLDRIPDDSSAVKSAKILAGKQELIDELYNINTYYFLTTAITKLEEQCSEKETQWALLMDVKEKLSGAAKEKLDKSLAKNPDVFAVATNKEVHYRISTKYAPLVTVDIERSFSIYKYLLSDRRCNLTEKNIEIMNVIYFNTFMDNKM